MLVACTEGGNASSATPGASKRCPQAPSIPDRHGSRRKEPRFGRSVTDGFHQGFCSNAWVLEGNSDLRAQTDIVKKNVQDRLCHVSVGVECICMWIKQQMHSIPY